MSQTSAYKVRVNTQTDDTKALILLANGALIGVLVELADECHGADRGKWAIEVALGIDDKTGVAPFESASDAADWLSCQLSCGPFKLAQVKELS